MKIDPTAFAQNPFFQGIDQSDIDAILNSGVVNRYEAGQPVFLEGDQGEAMYLLLSGEIEIEIRNKEGLGEVVAMLSAGDVFGEGSLLTGESRSATVIVSKDSWLLAFSRSGLEKLIEAKPRAASHFLLKLLSEVFERLRVTTHRLTQN